MSKHRNDSNRKARLGGRHNQQKRGKKSGQPVSIPMMESLEHREMLSATQVVNVAASTLDGTYKLGDTVAVTVTFDNPVVVNTGGGNPTLALNSGGAAVATYASGSGTTTLTFNYTVGTGDVSADLDYDAIGSLVLNGGTIMNDVDAATLTLAAPGAAGSLGANKALVIDGVVPAVTGVTATTANGWYKAGDVITITVAFDDSVTVTGTPTLALNSGGSATYASGSGTGTLSFTYTVAGGQTSADLDYVATTSLALSGGTIKDAAGNDATLTLATPGAAGSLGNAKAIVIDTTAQTVTGVTSTTANGTKKIGDVIAITVTFDGAVNLTGTPTLALNSGGSAVATYVSGSGTTTFTFNYTVGAGDTSADLDYDATGSLVLNGGTIKDAAGNDATLTLAAPGAAGSLGANKALVIDGVAPTVTNVTSTATNGTFIAGNTIAITVTFNDVVTVDTAGGTPTLALSSGGSTVATYASGSGTNTLTFNYVVAAGETSADLDYDATNSLVLNGGTIKDASGNNATLTLAAPGAAGSLGANKALVISDTVAATVTGVSSTAVNGTYSLSTTIPITITFSEPVAVTGTPTLALNNLGSASYASGSGTSTLTFNYTVAAGQNVSDLDYSGASALALAGGTIKDLATNNAVLTLAAPGAAGSLGANKNIAVNVGTPAVANVSSTLANGSYKAGQVVPITVRFSTSVVVTGTPTLALNDGGSASYASGSGTDTLTFNYTVGGGQNVADLDYAATTSLALAGGTIKDGAANNATLTLALPGSGGSLGFNKNLTVDTTAATVTGVTSPAGNGSFKGGAVIPITVTFTEPVVVTGTPTLALDSGGSATYASGSGTTTLTFSYTVGAGQNSLDLDYTATNSLALAGGTINDLGGNATTLTLAAPTAAGSLGANKALVIDTTAPTVSGVTSTTANGSYNAGDVIAITMTFPEAVTVDTNDGTPTLALGTGGTAVYASGSGSTTLTFNYTVGAGQTSADLDYVATTSLKLNGGTIKDAAGNNATLTLAAPGAANSLGANKALVIDTTAPVAPAITGITTDTGAADGVTSDTSLVLAGTAVAGSTVTVTRVGTGVIGTATADGSGDWTFDYTATVLTAGAYSFTATQSDAAGNVSAATAPFAVVVDTTAPTVTNVTSTKTNGAYGPGTVIAITVTFSEPVVVTGTPTLALGNTGSASYASGSGTNTLTFNYTVGAVGSGQTTADLDYAATGSLALAGGTIKDVAGTSATLTLPAPGATHSLGANKAVVIDTTGPTVTSVTSSKANGVYKAGTVIPITVTFNDAVTVVTTGGTPTLALNSGGSASYASGSGTNTLTFNYTVGAGQTSADLDYSATTSLALNGGTIRDSHGNNATLTLAAPAAAGSLGNSKALVIDTTAPTVTGVTSTTVNGLYNTGDVVVITVAFSTPVVVTGTPRLALGGGGSAVYASGSGTGTLTFNYTVAAGQSSADLDYAATNSLTVVGASIKDVAGNNAVLTLAAPGAAGSLGNSKALVIDAVLPTVTNVTATTANGSYKTGDVIAVTVTFSEAVTVTGTPTLKLNAGSTASAAYASGSGTSTLTFNYTVAAGENAADLNYQATGSLALAGGTIKDAASNNATLTLPALTAAGSLATNKAIVVDTTTPTVTGVTSTTANGRYNAGDVIAIVVTFSEPVTVNTGGGTPSLTLNTGGIATYASGSGTSSLTFNYTVAGGQTAWDLNYAAVTSLALNGGTIRDAALHNATLTLPALAAAGSLGTNKNIVVDTTASTVTGVTSTKANGAYKAGTAIAMQVTFSEAVTVDTAGGTPTLALNSGGTATYASGSGTNTLVFNYTVATGEASADLDYGATTSLALNGATIRDAAGNNATLTLAAPGAAGSLGANKALVIDTTGASVTNVTSTLASGSYDAGTVVPVTVTFSEPVTVTGAPKLALNVGAGVFATYASGSGTNTLTFNYTVAAGQNVADLDYAAATSLALNGGTIKDAAGNTAHLGLAGPGVGGSLGFNKDIVIDTTAPVVAGVNSTAANGTYAVAGEVIPVTVTFGSPVVVTGVPRLALNTGGFATYVSGSGTTVLIFNYTVAAGQTSPDLDYLGTGSLTLNGGTIQDLAGNNAVLTLAAPGAANSLGANKAIVIGA